MTTPMPAPGSFGLTRIVGPTRWWINVGQAINGDPSFFSHAFLVLDRGEIVEGWPGGARIRRLSSYLGKRDVVFCEPPMTDLQRQRVVMFGRGMKGTPYSFLDYLSIAAVRLGVRPPAMQRYVESSGHLICSALVDRTYTLGGVSLFDDGRICGDVTPGDLDRYRLTGKG